MLIGNDIKDAISLVWNNKFQEAENLLKDKSTISPRYSLHFAEIIFLRSFITADVKDTESALKRLKETRELAEKYISLLESNKTPPTYNQELKSKEEFKNNLLDCKLVLGDSLYMLAVLQLTRDHKIKGCFNLRKSWKTFEECLKQVKDTSSTIKYEEDLLECLHFGAGFFYFAMSIIPSNVIKFVELIGFKSDRDLGLQYIRDCSEKAGVRSAFATMVLLFNNLLLPRGLYNPTKHLKEAEVLIDDNLKRYPQGSLFQVMASHCYRKQCRVDLGLECMQRAIENCSALPKPPLIYSYELANCYLIKLDWSSAIGIFESLVKEENFQIRALCGLQLAGCYVMMGEPKKAQDAFTKIKDYVKKSSSVDPIILRQSQRYIANNGHFSAFEVMYIRRDMAKMERISAEKTLLELTKCAQQAGVEKPLACQANIGKNQPSTNSFFKSFSSLTKSKKDDLNTDNQIEDRASYLLLKGSVLKGIEKYEESMSCFEELMSIQHLLQDKNFYVPYCLYEMSESYFHRKQFDLSHDTLKKCNNHSNYDWEDPLKVKLRIIFDQQKKDGAGGGNQIDQEEEDQQEQPIIQSADQLENQMETLTVQE
ncbi:hypothetical protein DFA_01202 [Cavenderia fasciculata]|uniref:Tetratricopeptide-like helical domain-containing protein n=1 Tax=Cavenderia fasciculata TaxID=261658 RepID=F4PRI1_CACFS|nr:uncharacterized protein DFA_01202 [Cavenderia fasciculata]EGG21321.1 hypothetical protein DFA_01202 [Cavenderia fasciculata]|eukprot:XP_004359171.1 hypothetical protein DFA_01202 [Cavenderia fasciculata]